MTASVQEQSSIYRIAAASALVATSIAVPAAMLYWVVATILDAKPLGCATTEIRVYRHGSTHEGKLWFPVFDRPGETPASVRGVRLKSLDLETGEESETGIEFSREFVGWWKLAWVGDQLYFHSIENSNTIPGAFEVEIYRVDDSKFTLLDSNRPRPIATLGGPFEYEGKLTLAEAKSLDQVRLIHWIEDCWVEGREILWPSSNRVWFDDPQQTRRALLPITSEQPSAVYPPELPELTVVQQGGKTLVVAQNEMSPKLFAYRNGFEFADDHAAIASALEPVNSPREVSGWRPMSDIIQLNRYTRIVPAIDRVFLAIWAGWPQYGKENQQQFVRSLSDGSRDQLVRDDDPSFDGRFFDESMILADPGESAAYVLDFNRWSSLAIHRIDGGRIRPAHARTPGYQREYLVHWCNLSLGLLCAWLLHVAVLTVGTQLLTQRSGLEFKFASTVVELASPVRRLMAFVADGMIVLFVFGLVFWWSCSDLLPNFDSEFQNQTSRYLLMVFESRIELDFRTYGIIWGAAKSGWRIIDPLGKWLQYHPQAAILFLGCSAALYLARWYLEGRYNLTPGKWLLGIRTVRTTLRPIGFARSLARDLMIWFDFPLLITPIPAAISMIFSDRRQRLGDRIADTIVIRMDNNIANRSITR